MPAPRLTSLLIAALLLTCGLPAPGRSQTDPAGAGVSDALAADLGKLRELTGAKNYASALALLDRLLAASAADSYERTLLSQLKAQVFLADGRYTDAIAPLETALQVGETRGHFTDAGLPEALFLLAQLHQQQATDLKDPVRQRTSLDRSATYLRRWQNQVGKPTPAGQLFAASLFYQQVTLDPDRVDDAALRETQRAAQDGLFLTTQPAAALHVLLLAVYQQRGELTAAAELLELLLEKNPDSASYWQQLTSTYLTLATEAKNEREANRHRLRALLAFERAQARGLLNRPDDHFNCVAILLGLRQFDLAISRLEQGLADRTLDHTRRNWELLASSYQQTRREPEAVAALENAVRALPAEGQLEFTLAQLLYANNRLADARDRLELAIKKGGLDKPGQAHLFLAYTAYELQDYAAAARRAGEATAFGDVKKDDLARLSQAIDEAVRARDASGVSKL